MVTNAELGLSGAAPRIAGTPRLTLSLSPAEREALLAELHSTVNGLGDMLAIHEVPVELDRALRAKLTTLTAIRDRLEEL